MTAVRRSVEFTPGYNRVAEGCGRHGMHVEFTMVAPKGAVVFAFNTGWVPGVKGIPPTISDQFPMAWDLGYHWPSPMYAEQTLMANDCRLIGGECYYGGSSLNAQPILAAFLVDGEDAVWDALDDYYRRLVETTDDWIADAVAAS